MRISTATSADVSLLSNLIRDAFRDVADRFELTADNCPRHPSNCNDAWIRSDLDRRVRYFILRASDVPVGCVALEQANDDLTYLERLSVVPERRECGFGRALVEHALCEAERLGARLVRVGIIADHTELKRWYEGIGFREEDSREFPHLPFLVTFMSYDLKQRPPTKASGRRLEGCD